MATQIPVADLISAFQRMLRERWAYEWNGAQAGRVSCAGAFVWAYRQHGLSVYHGSNRIAREEAERLMPIGSVTLVPGMAVFKRRTPGDPAYSLPSAYRPGGSHDTGDFNDYYHIGLVDEDVTRVLNAQGTATGFVASPVSQGWTHAAYLRQVDYGTTRKEAPDTAAMEIFAHNGKAVNLREGPSTSKRSLKQLPVGTPAELLGIVDEIWARVSAAGCTGYVMRAFLRGGSATPDNGSATPDSGGATSDSGGAARPSNPADPSDIEARLTRLEARVTALEGGHG